MLLASLLTIQIFSCSTCGESRQWVLHQVLLETGRHVHMEFMCTTLLTSIMIGSSLSYVHHSRYLTTFQSLLRNIEFSCDTVHACTPIEIVCLVLHGVNVQPQAGFGGHWYFIICSFPQMLVHVLAASCDVRWTSPPAVAATFPSRVTGHPRRQPCSFHSCRGQSTHRGSHVPFTGTGCLRRQPRSLHGGQGADGDSHIPFTGDRAPTEAATFPSQGTGHPCKHSSTTRGGGVNLCSE